MKYAPKTVCDNKPKIHKHITTPISQAPNTLFKILNRSTVHSTLHIQYTILQNIIDKFNILENTQSIQNRYIQHTVGSDL
jgi:hypothetical protein